ncbi:MAG: DedA family protein [Patescibacteria group bacterium]
MTNFTDLILTYGYPFIFLGSMLEGEVVLVLGGLVAYAGILKLHFILLFAILGAITADICWFMIGRKKGIRIFEKYPWLEKLSRKPQAMIHKNPKVVSFLMRFMYGFRNVVPLSLGMSSIKTSTFILYNSLGAVIWVLVIGLAGYFFGDIMEVFIGRLRHNEFRIIIIAVVAFSLIHGAIKLFKFLFRKYNNAE